MAQCLDYDEDEDSVCRVIKNVSGGDFYPLTNSFVAIENLYFTLTNEDLPKVTVEMTLRPSYKKGLSSSVVDANRMHIQTTISDRFIETY